MKQDKTYQTIWDCERSKSTTNNCQNIVAAEDSNIDTIRISVKNAGGIFILHYFLLVVGSAVTILAMLQQKLKAKLSVSTATKHSNLPTRENSSRKSVRATKLAAGLCVR